MSTGIISEVQIILWVLIIVSTVAVLVRRIRVPYTLGLIFAGLIISYFQIPLGIHLTPELLLTIFLPGLLFEGAMNVDTDYLIRNIKSITLFAIFGLLLSVMAAGSVLHFVLGVPWEISFLFASMIAPTDPIAVIDIFRRLGVSKKLGVLIEGESLFNDGTGIVLFRIFLALVVTGSFSLTSGIFQFIKLALGGILLGFILGYLSSRLFFRKVKDTFIKLTLTTVLAYGSYLVAEHLGFSGVISTVVSGLVIGGYGFKFLSSQSKLEISSLWNYLGFILNSFVFLLIGVEIQVEDLISYVYPILMGFLAILIGRAIAVYLLSQLINRVDDSKLISGVNEFIPFDWQHVVVWGGLHGGLSMVLALSLPTDNPLLAQWRPFLLSTIFGVVFLSLVFQGTTMAPLLSKLGLSKKNERSEEYELEVARILMYDEAERELDKFRSTKIISRKMYNKISKDYKEMREEAEEKLSKMLEKHKEIEEEQKKEIEYSILIAQKNVLIEGGRKSLFSQKTLDKMLEEINKKLFELQKDN